MTKVLDIFKSKQAFVICQECNHKGRFDEFKIEDSIMMHCPHCHYSFNRKRHKISSIWCSFNPKNTWVFLSRSLTMNSVFAGKIAITFCKKWRLLKIGWTCLAKICKVYFNIIVAGNFMRFLINTMTGLVIILLAVWTAFIFDYNEVNSLPAFLFHHIESFFSRWSLSYNGGNRQ